MRGSLVIMVGLLWAVPAAVGQAGGPRVGVAVSVSTLGVGGQLGLSATRHIGGRLAVNALNVNRSLTRDGIHYDGTLRLRSAALMLDLYPLGGNFRVSPGVLAWNDNRLDADANVPGGQTFTLGGNTYRSNPADPVRGDGRLDFGRVAPAITIGWGNHGGRRGPYFFTESGVAFHGRPRVGIQLAGSACDPGSGFCLSATNPQFQADIRAEERRLEDRASSYRVYPILSFGVGFRF